MQLYQKNFLLKTNTNYRLSFAATSNTGDDVVVYLHRHTAPYTKYGINGLRFDLTQSWQRYSTEFTTTGFSGTTSDTRLRFWFSGVAKNGDVYLIDDVILEEVNGSATATPSQTPDHDGDAHRQYGDSDTGCKPHTYGDSSRNQYPGTIADGHVDARHQDRQQHLMIRQAAHPARAI